MTGRKPKPTRLKLLQGNPGKRRLNSKEPQPAQEMPRRPEWLSRAAKREWAYIAEELFRLGLLSRIDRAALAAYCQAYADWQEAEGMLKRHGKVKLTAQGYEYQSPWVGIRNRALEHMHKFLTEFGLTPASRVRLSVAPPDRKSLLEEFLGGS